MSTIVQRACALHNAAADFWNGAESEACWLSYGWATLITSVEINLGSVRASVLELPICCRVAFRDETWRRAGGMTDCFVFPSAACARTAFVFHLKGRSSNAARFDVCSFAPSRPNERVRKPSGMTCLVYVALVGSNAVPWLLVLVRFIASTFGRKSFYLSPCLSRLVCLQRCDAVSVFLCRLLHSLAALSTNSVRVRKGIFFIPNGWKKKKKIT